MSKKEIKAWVATHIKALKANGGIIGIYIYNLYRDVAVEFALKDGNAARLHSFDQMVKEQIIKEMSIRLGFIKKRKLPKNLGIECTRWYAKADK